MHSKSKNDLSASPGQRGVYREIAGEDLPADVTRREAVAAIKRALARELEAQAGAELSAFGSYKGASKEPRTVVPGRLFIAAVDSFNPDLMKEMTLIIIMGGIDSMAVPKNGVVLFWDAGDNVDEQLLQGVVRLVASTMHGVCQRVLLLGSSDSIVTVAACVLREYAGIDSVRAVSALRRICGGNALTKQPLKDTIRRYQVS